MRVSHIETIVIVHLVDAESTVLPHEEDKQPSAPPYIKHGGAGVEQRQFGRRLADRLFDPTGQLL